LFRTVVILLECPGLGACNENRAARSLGAPGNLIGLPAAAALASLQPRQLSEGARLCLNDAVMHGTGHVELRTRIDGVVVEVVLVPTDGSEPLCLTRMVQQT